ncbi:MAG: FAD-dependent oxidoreductase [Clostridiales bacterium]|nr:FAD-dependent oxidoreductase [Clostridiales bacterium]
MKKPVMVVGGGIAGIQASHDLAEMGIPVFLVEKSPSIGGRMAQLDKTFPTNDCSACILAPKVTSCFNHPLVKTLSYSDLLEIKGEAPDLTAVVRRKPRFIDEEACKGCNDCFDTCPVTVKSEFDMAMGDRKAIYKPFAQAVPNKAIIDKKGTSPCKFECPAHMDAHAYITLAGLGKYDEALGVIRRTTPFAGVLGRVCLHPCETNCTRQYVEEPLSIAGIKRFVADKQRKDKGKIGIEVCAEQKDEKIAVVGSGPAGLNCAYKLALEGYQVTVFEALPVAGGMLKVGIPDYRLDKQVLLEEIGLIEDMGVEIRLNTKIGKDLTLQNLISQGYKAVFLAVGAHRDMKLGIPGEDAEGVMSSVDFLREVNLGSRKRLDRRVLVIGGGNVAMDAARSAARLGCDVTVVYRRTQEEMPANEWEVEHAMEEGVRFEFLAAPTEIVMNDGKVCGILCTKNKLGKPDASGRRRPEAIPGSSFAIEADIIIKSIGQFADSADLEAAGFNVFDEKGRIDCDRDTMKAGVAGIFCGGDALRGPATMIEAVADGNRAAKAIINYIENKDLPIEPFLLPQTRLEDIDTRQIKQQGRTVMPMLEQNIRTKTFHEVELGFDERQAMREAQRCVDCSICCECKLCEETCQADAICHDQAEQMVEIPVSSVVFCSGYDTPQDIPPEFGYERYEDVVTSLEYERILSAGGPYSGHVQRPSDNRPPKRIAFIQCVGSRDNQCGADYCSSVCCMYAIKEAMITKEHLPTVEDIDIYFMDMRAYGKDFDKYVDSAKSKYNIGFVRSRISNIDRDEGGQLVVRYADEGGAGADASYDIVVLSVGMKPRAENVELLNRSGVRTDSYGFICSGEFGPPATSKEGIYACGVAAGPKDIPETVIEASAAAAGAAKTAKDSEVDLYSDYSRFFTEKITPPLRDVSKEPVKIGVFICHCGVNIGGYLDIDEIVEYAKTLPFVAYAEQNIYTCSVDAQKQITDTIAELGLNRIVVASCTPRTHEPLFQDVLMQAGLNPYLFAMANIRDQCSWVHMDVPDAATYKAKELVRMAVGKATNAKQLTRKKIDVEKTALIIGGGVSGMSAALEIAGMGYRAYLIDKDSRLGGNALGLAFTNAGRPALPYIEEMAARVQEHPFIDVYLDTTVDTINGYVGNYTTTLKCGEIPREISHGVVIVAVGAHEQKPVEYLYGQDRRVVTMLEFEQQYVKEGFAGLKGVKDIVMIQCVGSREEDRPYCSRVCCSQALKNALLLKEYDKDITITVLYREMRAYGTNELAYKEARRAGVRFVRYDVERKPVVSKEGSRLSVKVYEPVLGKKIAIPADGLILSSAIVPDVGNNSQTAQMLKVPLNQEGFFLEAHVKLRPVDFATEGVYMCGLAHSPKNMRESIIQGKAAAGRAATVISKSQLETEGTIATVDANLCAACGDCELVCAYKAVEVTDVPVRGGTVRRAVVNDVLCKGCGTCAATCRCGAIDVGGFSDKQVLAEIRYMLRKAIG